MTKTKLNNALAMMACTAALLAGCNDSTPQAYAGQQLQLTPEQIQAMTPEQLQAVMLAQQQAAPPVAPMPAPAPAAAPEQSQGMDPLAAGLLGAGAGALAGGLIGNSMGKSSATANAALANTQNMAPAGYNSAPRTVVNKTTIIKQYAAPAPARTSIGSTYSKPMNAAPKVPPMSRTFRSTSSRRR